MSRRAAAPRRRWLLALVGGGGLVVALLVAGILLRPGAPPAPAPVSRLETADYHSLALVPGNPDRLFFGHHFGVLKSSDAGRTWAAVAGISQDAMSLSVSRQNPQAIYLAGHEVLLKSEDGGQTWRDVQNDLPGLDLHWFALHPEAPDRLYAYAVGFGFFRSSDGGATWSPWNIAIPARLVALAVLGGDPERLLGGIQEGSLLISHDGGATWRQVTDQRLDSPPTGFALNPDAGTIYAATEKGVHRSADGGLTWRRLPLQTPVAALAAGGTRPERVVVVNHRGEVFRSDDGGLTW